MSKSNSPKVTIASNAPKVKTGAGDFPSADSKTLTSNIGSAFHGRPASTEGTELSVVVNDGTGLCK